MTQLYNRSLLTEFGVEQFYTIIDRAVSWTDSQGDKISDELRTALKARLEFRKEFLDALDQDLDVMQSRSTESFVSSLSKVPLIEKSVSLGKSVPDAFSLKIQRKLASTVPPRPMVKISHEDALDHLKRFCRDAIDIQEILDYRGPENLRVWYSKEDTEQTEANMTRWLSGAWHHGNHNRPFTFGRFFKLSSSAT